MRELRAARNSRQDKRTWQQPAKSFVARQQVGVAAGIGAKGYEENTQKTTAGRPGISWPFVHFLCSKFASRRW
jgi:hypothetical protein